MDRLEVHSEERWIEMALVGGLKWIRADFLLMRLRRGNVEEMCPMTMLFVSELSVLRVVKL